MSLNGIALYCLRAGAFAIGACALYWIYCHLKGRRPTLKRLLAVAYLAALVQITVLRGGVDWQKLFSGPRDLHPVPFATTLQLLQGSLWNLVYNVAGNIAWFVPLGMLLHRRNWHAALIAGAGLSLCIELCQFVLMTGVSDIDDLIFNALGAWTGWMLCRCFRRK